MKLSNEEKKWISGKNLQKLLFHVNLIFNNEVRLSQVRGKTEHRSET